MAQQRGKVPQDGDLDQVNGQVEEGGGEGALEAVAGDGVLDVGEGEGGRGEGEGFGGVVAEEDVAVGSLWVGMGGKG